MATLAELGRLAFSGDPVELCRVVADAMTAHSIIGSGVLAAVEQSSGVVMERFISLAGLDEADAETVRGLPFLWLPAGEREVALVCTEGERCGQWGIHAIDQLRAGIVRGAAADGYDRALRRPRLRVVK
jgi:hypothetical protein